MKNKTNIKTQNKKKTFILPEVEIVHIEDEDILTNSGNSSDVLDDWKIDEP